MGVYYVLKVVISANSKHSTGVKLNDSPPGPVGRRRVSGGTRPGDRRPSEPTPGPRHGPGSERTARWRPRRRETRCWPHRATGAGRGWGVRSASRPRRRAGRVAGRDRAGGCRDSRRSRRTRSPPAPGPRSGPRRRRCPRRRRRRAARRRTATRRSPGGPPSSSPSSASSSAAWSAGHPSPDTRARGAPHARPDRSCRQSRHVRGLGHARRRGATRTPHPEGRRRSEPRGDVLGEVSEDQVGTGPLDRHQ